MEIFRIKEGPRELHKYTTDQHFKRWMERFDDVPSRVGLLITNLVIDQGDLKELEEKYIAEHEPGDPNKDLFLTSKLKSALSGLERLLVPIHNETMKTEISEETRRWLLDDDLNEYLYEASKITMHPATGIAELTQDHRVFGHARKQHRMTRHTTEIHRLEMELRMCISRIDLPGKFRILNSLPTQYQHHPFPPETDESTENVSSSAQDELPQYSLASSATQNPDTVVASSSRNNGSLHIQPPEGKAEAFVSQEKGKARDEKVSQSRKEDPRTLPPPVLQQPPKE